MFDTIIGNDSVKEHLRRAAERGMSESSYLFSGPEGIGKSLFALEFAKLLIGDSAKLRHGNHPDIYIYRPEGKIGMHSIESMRAFRDEICLPPLEASWKIFIIEDADKMLPASANALLKTFEEPPKGNIIILLSSSPENFLPTILSRCRKVYFQPVPEDILVRWLTEEKGIDRETAEKYVPFSSGSVREALRLCQCGQDEIRTHVINYLTAGPSDYLELKQFIKTISQVLEDIKVSLEKSAAEEIAFFDPEDLTAFQKAALEKEIDGAVSSKFQQETDRLIGLILSWYRDLHLLRAEGSPRLLANPDCVANLKKQSKNPLPSLEAVERLVEQARLAIKRFVPIENALESLFLELMQFPL